MSDSVSPLRRAAGTVASTVFPRLDEHIFWRQRRTRQRELLGSESYGATMRLHAAELSERLANGAARPSHLVVVPQFGEGHESYRPGTRNFYYETAQNARENYGADRVSVFTVEPQEPFESWHPRLIDHLVEVRATHLITHIETDPGHLDGTWNWDLFWAAVHERWDGVLLGVMFDSAYRWIRAKAELLGRMSPRFMIVDICMPMDGSVRRGRPEVGPVNMPVSRESLALVEDRIADIEPQYDVSFIGVLYPYRTELLERIRATGASVAVNPHRPDGGGITGDARDNQPSWLDYMAGLASSRMTLNFSRSSAGPYEQLKTRVIEATLAGTLLLTDDRDRTRLFFEPEVEFGAFTGVEDLPSKISSWLADPERLETARRAGQERARAIAHEDFLGGIDRGLIRRGLPTLGA